MKNIKPEDWMPDAGITLEEAADQAVRSSHHVLVIAGPGAGKTELLAQKAAYLFQTNNCKAPRKILAISFKKDAAENLKERVEKRCGSDVKDRFTWRYHQSGWPRKGERLQRLLRKSFERYPKENW